MANKSLFLLAETTIEMKLNQKKRRRTTDDIVNQTVKLKIHRRLVTEWGRYYVTVGIRV